LVEEEGNNLRIVMMMFVRLNVLETRRAGKGKEREGKQKRKQR
jgi:hypothetical protein